MCGGGAESPGAPLAEGTGSGRAAGRPPDCHSPPHLCAARGPIDPPKRAAAPARRGAGLQGPGAPSGLRRPRLPRGVVLTRAFWLNVYFAIYACAIFSPFGEGRKSFLKMLPTPQVNACFPAPRRPRWVGRGLGRRPEGRPGSRARASPPARETQVWAGKQVREINRARGGGGGARRWRWFAAEIQPPGRVCMAPREGGFSWGPCPEPLPGTLGHLPLGHQLGAGKGVEWCQCQGSGPHGALSLRVVSKELRPKLPLSCPHLMSRGRSFIHLLVHPSIHSFVHLTNLLGDSHPSSLLGVRQQNDPNPEPRPRVLGTEGRVRGLLLDCSSQSTHAHLRGPSEARAGPHSGFPGPRRHPGSACSVPSSHASTDACLHTHACRQAPPQPTAGIPPPSLGCFPSLGPRSC